jgi:hypothetical protein
MLQQRLVAEIKHLKAAANIGEQFGWLEAHDVLRACHRCSSGWWLRSSTCGQRHTSLVQGCEVKWCVGWWHAPHAAAAGGWRLAPTHSGKRWDSSVKLGHMHLMGCLCASTWRLQQQLVAEIKHLQIMAKQLGSIGIEA